MMPLLSSKEQKTKITYCISSLRFLFLVAIGFRLAKKNEKAKEAFEKASKGQEMLSSYPYFLFLLLQLGIICLVH